MDPIGEHLMLDMSACYALSNTKLRDMMERAVNSSGANILGILDHAFEPQGYSCVVLISESHASLHTFPEEDTYYVDYFTCGGVSSEQFEEVITNTLNPKTIKRKTTTRDKPLSGSE